MIEEYVIVESCVWGWVVNLRRYRLFLVFLIIIGFFVEGFYMIYLLGEEIVI